MKCTRYLLVATLGLLACDKAPKVAPVTPSPPPAERVQTPAPRPPRMPVAMPDAEEVKRLASSSNALGFELFRARRSAPGNLVLSPASISAALAMTYGGARGETEAQMKRTLELEGPREAVMAGWGKLSLALQDPARPLKLRIASRLFGEKTVKFEHAFLDALQSAYGAPLEATDFQNASEGARAHINGWVEEQTERRIVDLLPPATLDKTSRLVLVNAISFVADWAEPFERAATADEVFNVSATSGKRTPMMHQDGLHPFAKVPGAKVLELPYTGNAGAMVFILPDRADGLADVEKSLSAAKLDAWRAALAPQTVSVTLPRFEVAPSPSMSLGEELAKLGMPDAFDRARADFTGIANPADRGDRLRIDEVFHKAFVKVDEKGTEAAAATAVTMRSIGGLAPAKAPEFKADHPFLFAIIDKPSGLVLFIGRVADPTME